MKKIVLRLGIAAFMLLLIWGIFNRSLLQYGLQQAKGQLEVILNAKPLEDFLNDPTYPDSLKSKIKIAQKARLFAIEELGLKESNNYTKMYDQKGKVILWNVSACDPYKLEAYEWKFPFLGSMPYKGFFKLEKAKQEKKRLENEGFDTRIRPVGGWSTLGILNDPILSNMLSRSEGALAEVIIHEMTHSTLFVKDEITFNENLASFIGEEGALLFLEKEFGAHSPQIRKYQQAEQDSRKLRKHLLSGSKHLDSLYSALSLIESDSIKSKKKKRAIHEIVSGIDTISFHNQRYKALFKDQLPNNAHFMSYQRYHSQKDTLQMLYQAADQSLKKLILQMKEVYAK